MNDLPKSAISPLVIATKLAAAANLTAPAFAKQIQKEPRLVELLWFLQWLSMQPGGLDKFALELIEQFPRHFGPAIVHDENGPLTLERREQIWKAISGMVENELIPFQSWATEKGPDDADDYETFARSIGSYPKPCDPTEEKRFRAALMKLPRAKFRDVFIDAAKDRLGSHLRALCMEDDKDRDWMRRDCGGALMLEPWYCENLVTVLLEAMDLHAGRIELQLARTEVVSLVFDRLDYAWQKKVLVKIEGDTRTGKTESVKAWCVMNPGKARLVSTPSGKSCTDLFKAIAEAIGLSYGPKSKSTDLKDQIQYVISHAGLFLVLDEAHFLLPANFDRNTQPARLDWLRTRIIDRKLPVALVTTPQAFRHSANRFEKWTGYNFGQFFGRVMLNVTLPNELSEEDLLGVVKIQGPDIPEKFHRFIVARAMQSEGYLKAIEAVCSRASYVARRDGHPVVTQADVELALSEVIPAQSAPVKLAPGRPPAPPAPLAVKRTRPPAPVAAARPTLQAPSRQTSPAPALEAPDRTTSLEMETV